VDALFERTVQDWAEWTLPSTIQEFLAARGLPRRRRRHLMK
jgi:hypothetical protein